MAMYVFLMGMPYNDCHLTSGRVNFLLLINDRYPTSVIKTADIIILEGEGIEDVSVLTINISYLGETLEEDA